MKKFVKKYFATFIREFRSLDMPAWNYLEYEKTMDPRYLLRLKEYYELPELFPHHLERLKLIAEEMIYSVAQFELELHTRNKNIFAKRKKIEVLEAEYLQVYNIVHYLGMAGRDEEMEAALAKLGYAIRPGREFDDELRRIMNQNENTKIKINDHREELSALLPRNNESAKADIDRLLINIERNERREVDLKKISLRKWLLLKGDLVKTIERRELKQQQNGK